ncbi:MAG TPA: hypothetical protein DCZ88_10910 [Pseudanabaena sp.]|nr:hypothetical protein [Pseudanabaena sp.]
MKFYLSIGQYQIPQDWQRTNLLAISDLVMTILDRDRIGILGNISGDRGNLESLNHSTNLDSWRDALTVVSGFTRVSRFISAINPETYPSGRYRQVALPI